jgi:hypothetical protein
MNANFLHKRREVAESPPDVVPDELAALLQESRACCCPARPVVRMVMPPALDRPHPTDLLLCGHHYRASRAALDAAGAVACPLGGMASDVPDALVPVTLG